MQRTVRRRRVRHEDDRDAERVAEARSNEQHSAHDLQHAVGNAALGRMLHRTAAPDRVRELRPTSGIGTGVIRRYQAGSAGHGGLEEEALGASGAGFSESEVHSIYLGNWLRDFSQVPKNAATIELLNMLALGEHFGTEISPDLLGGYLPSEHMDNPEAAGSAEDPRLSDFERWTKRQELSPEQQKEYLATEAERQRITERSAASHLPTYIERGKIHAAYKLHQAVALGRTPDGMRALGDALHSVEDYFSHSNFVEACILRMGDDPAFAPLAHALTEAHLGRNLALLVPTGADGRATIQTGTYATSADSKVSLLETLQSQALSGELLGAFVEGYLLRMGMTGEQLGRLLTQQAGRAVGTGAGVIAGGIGGGVYGALNGAAEGVAHGWARGRGFWNTAGAMFEDAAGMGAEGAEAGAQAGALDLADSWGTAGEEGAGIAGAFVGRSIGQIIAIAGAAVVIDAIGPGVVIGGLASMFVAAKTGLFEAGAELATDLSGGQARAQGLAGPTHSELAKDGGDHPLFHASMALAHEADTRIGTAVRLAWEGRAHEDLDGLVETFVSHPADNAWWQPHLRRAASSGSR